MMKALLTVLILVYAASSTCTGDHQINGLQVGVINLQAPIGNPNSQAIVPYIHNFDNAFTTTPHVAFGLQDVEVRVTSPDQLGQYSVRILQRTQSRVRFALSHARGGWRSTRISIMMSVNPQVTLGTSSINLQSFSASTINKQITTEPFSNPERSQAYAFINGITLNNGTMFQLQIIVSQIKQSMLNVGIMAGPMIDVRTVFLSYFIIDKSNLDFVYYSGFLRVNNFVGEGSANLFKQAVAPSYALFGLNRINMPSTFILKSELSDDFAFEYSLSTRGEFTYSCVILDTLPNVACASCTEIYSYGKQCVNQCPAGSYIERFPGNSLGCVKCSPKLNLVVNSAGTGCTCAAGFNNVNGTCIGTGQTQNIIPNQQNANILPNRASTQTNSYNPNILPRTDPNSARNTNSYVPQAAVINQDPVNSTQTNSQSQSQSSSNADASNFIQAYTKDDCSSFPNTYWTGYRCACSPGYKLDQGTGNCLRIGLVIVETKPQVNQTCGQNSYFNGVICACNEGYSKDSSGKCQANVVCPPNSQYIGNACICKTGYQKKGQECIKKCTEFSTLIGNQCVCDKGYQKEGEICKLITNRCPPNSYLSSNNCVCKEGFVQNQQNPLVCSRCPTGAYFDGTKCIFTCGQYESYNSLTKKCECQKGFGYNGKTCSQCDEGFFLKDNYCVACPIGSIYNAASANCECQKGYQMIQGRCSNMCGAQQMFDPANNKCVCKDGLALINGVCSICPAGTFPDSQTQTCKGCHSSHILIGNKCVCRSGLGFGANGECQECDHIVDGYCVTCPRGRVWNNELSKCACPSGQKQTNGKCEQICQSNELVDSNGNCYTCPIGQTPKEGACVCLDGSQRDPTNGCQKVCKDNAYKIGPYCIMCPLNTVFDSQLQACICKQGWFKNANKICEPSNIPPITCNEGKFYDPQQGCVSCSADCAACEGSATHCVTCKNPAMIAVKGRCMFPCGNGVINSGEQCDDNNTRSGDGCSSTCKVESGFTCQSSPSVCIRPTPSSNCGNGKIEAGEKCDDNNQKNGDGCSASCLVEKSFTCSGQPSKCKAESKGMQLAIKPLINSRVVYVQVRTDQTFTFENERERQNFMKYNFQAGTEPASASCNQVGSDPRLFNCYFMYPSGAPLRQYNIILSYDYKGSTGLLEVLVDYRESAFATRSLG